MTQDAFAKLAAGAEAPITEGYRAVLATFNEHFGDLARSQQVAHMALLAGAFLLDRVKEEAEIQAGRSSSTLGQMIPIVKATSALALDGVSSAFTCAFLSSLKKG